jgi:hypothetical protein
LPFAVSDFVVAALEQYGFAMDEGFGYGSPGTLNDATECCPRHPHLATGLLLGQPFEVRQTDGLHLVDGQTHLLHLP